MSDRTVLWLGGMSGVGKTTAGRAVARRHDLWFYSLDSRTYAHAERLWDELPTADALWIDRTPEQAVDDWFDESRRRMALVREELASIPDDGAPVLVEGPQLPPGLSPALYIVANPEVQRALVTARGSLAYSRTRDPGRALANRLRRDELLRERLLPNAVDVSDVDETEPLVDAFVQANAREWLAQTDRGDVAARRRDDNERRLDQWRRYTAVEPRAREGAIELACECDRPGCTDVVETTLDGASNRPRLAHDG
jgi:hypothetical protein